MITKIKRMSITLLALLLIAALSGCGSSRAAFRVIGYYPDWYGDVSDAVDWSKVTHVNYAFAIPTVDGEVRPFDDESVAGHLIAAAHENKVEVGLALGGWSYMDVPLQATFEQATDSAEKRARLVESVAAAVDKYGFDGVDVDWEYPTDRTAEQYGLFMTELDGALEKRGKWLSIAVMGGVDGNGNALMGAFAYSEEVLELVDWVNVMAYDGDAGSGHSPYDYAVNCGSFWINRRGVPKEKVNIGVPFYERPGWTAYADIVAADPENAHSDSAMVNGKKVYYNGLDTMAAKTRWACENAGGVMIWELTQDSKDQSLSLLNCIAENVREYYSDAY